MRADAFLNLQQRFYDPAAGRFLSVDPDAVDTSLAINFNRFSYAANSPYVFVDPDGRRNGRANSNPTLADLTPKQKIAVVNIILDNEGIEISRPIFVGSPESQGAIIDGGAITLGDTEFATRSKLHATLHHEAGHENVEAPATNDRELAIEESAMYQMNIDNSFDYGSTEEEIKFFESERDKARDRAESFNKPDKAIQEK